MEFLFQQAKNNELTAVADNIYLHSSYNPSREAERYVNNINVSYPPTLILVLEPAVSYVIKFLKIRFPEAKIAVIRYVKEFSNFNKDADYVIDYFNHSTDFENYLFNILGEEKIFGALVLQWQPSSKIFPEIENNVITAIKNDMEKSKTLLITREFFEKKWLINSCNFIKYVNNIVIIKDKIKLPTVIISSGPSLKDSLKIIKNNEDKLFVICLSSAIKVCLSNDITPDLCISTDGGFWAGEHLKALHKKNIPLALPLEGFCPKIILKNNKILPLVYNDGISKELADVTKIEALQAERNGTVSGTALLLALSLCENDIFFCGLDMTAQKGFQHCQPNEIELNNSLKDNKLKSKERRSSISEYSKGVLPIYKEWFDCLHLQNRKVYRIIEEQYKKNTLGEIKDIKASKFALLISEKKCASKNNISSNIFKEIYWQKNLKNTSEYLQKNLKSEKWIKNIFPLSLSSLSHNPNNTDIIKRLENEHKKLLIKTENILNEQ